MFTLGSLTQDAKNRPQIPMRIISGKYKGRALIAPKGRATRPTSERTREALFNVLTHAAWAPDIAGARVIDLFAGSGALGFEALSRDAAFCLFVETAHGARGAIRETIEAMHVQGNTRLFRRSAIALGASPASLEAPFDIAFIDPPYGKGLVPPCLKALQQGGWLNAKAVAMIETAADEVLSLPGWQILDERRVGAARISFVSHD